MCPDVEHVDGLVTALDEEVDTLHVTKVVVHEIFLGAPVKVGAEAEAFPADVKTETAVPGSDVVLAEEL